VSDFDLQLTLRFIALSVKNALKMFLFWLILTVVATEMNINGKDLFYNATLIGTVLVPCGLSTFVISCFIPTIMQRKNYEGIGLISIGGAFVFLYIVFSLVYKFVVSTWLHILV